MVDIGLVSPFLLALLIISLCGLEGAMTQYAGADAHMGRIFYGQSCCCGIPEQMRADGYPKCKEGMLPALLIDRHLGLGGGLRGDLEVILYGGSPAS